MSTFPAFWRELGENGEKNERTGLNNRTVGTVYNARKISPVVNEYNTARKRRKGFRKRSQKVVIS